MEYSEIILRLEIFGYVCLGAAIIISLGLLIGIMGAIYNKGLRDGLKQTEAEDRRYIEGEIQTTPDQTKNRPYK